MDSPIVPESSEDPSQAALGFGKSELIVTINRADGSVEEFTLREEPDAPEGE